MTGKWAPLLSNPEVRRRTRVLMWLHEQKLAKRERMSAASTEAAAFRAALRQLRAVIADPAMADGEKVIAAAVVLDAVDVPGGVA